MNGPGAVFLLEIEGAGHALPTRIRLETGKRLEPISFGTRAQWVLVGAGVNDVHGYLAFDGAQLYIQSANPMYPLRVEGAPVAAGWQAVVPPARIQVGLLTLAYLAEGALEEATQAIPEAHRLPTASDQDVTRYQPIDVPEPVRDEMVTRVDVSMFETSADDATRPGVPFEDSSQYDQTRVNYDSPLHAGQARHDLSPATVPTPFAPTPPGGHVAHSTDPAPPLFPSSYVAPRPAAGMPALGTTLALPGSPQAPPNPVDLARTRPGGTPSGILDLPPPPAPPPAQKPSPREVARELLTKLKAQWKEVSLPKKLVVVMMPFCFVAVAVLFGDKSPPQRAAPAPHESPSAAATSATSTTAPGAVPPSSAPAPSPTQQTAAPLPASAQAQPPAAPAAAAASPPPVPAPVPPSTGGKTAERLAVDAVAAGAYQEAATRYESLAREHPDQPVYREAARILRSRADAGTP